MRSCMRTHTRMHMHMYVYVYMCIYQVKIKRLDVNLASWSTKTIYKIYSIKRAKVPIIKKVENLDRIIRAPFCFCWFMN